MCFPNNQQYCKFGYTFSNFFSSHEEIVPFKIKDVNIYLNAPERQNANEYSTENQLNELSSITGNKEVKLQNMMGKY